MQKAVSRLNDFQNLTKFKISIPVAVDYCGNHLDAKISEDEQKNPGTKFRQTSKHPLTVELNSI